MILYVCNVHMYVYVTVCVWTCLDSGKEARRMHVSTAIESLQQAVVPREKRSLWEPRHMAKSPKGLLLTYCSELFLLSGLYCLPSRQNLILGAYKVIQSQALVSHLNSHRSFLVVLVGKIDGPGLPGGLIIYQGHLFPRKGRLCQLGNQTEASPGAGQRIGASRPRPRQAIFGSEPQHGAACSTSRSPS